MKYCTDRELLLHRLKRVARTRSVSNMKHDVKFTDERVLTTIVEVLECGNPERYAVHNVWCVCLTDFSDFDCYIFYVCEAYFHAESIGTSPVIRPY